MPSETLFVVGAYLEKFNTATGQSLPCGDIYQSTGLLAHLQKRHPEEVGLIEHIPDVIHSPDYIGHNPNEPNSVELIKIMDKNVMVCVKLDTKKNYLYVASVFSVSDAKVTHRLRSGRIVRYS